ncbi:Uncharacterized conserved protein YraI [Variovorax sp. OV329]|nr:Uncharacterized conserved protein YraI [Variovorax sp. OV329]
MWLRWRIRQAVVAGLLALPLAAMAQQAVTRAGVTLMAGPGNSYPAVAELGQGQPVDVMGCTQGYGWCDVMLPDGLRGWVFANALAYPYQGTPVPLAGYGAVIGVPIITFSVGNYWGRYYRDRPWYGEPRWWGGRPPPPPPPGWRPPPPGRPAWQPHPGPPPPNFRPPRPPAWQQPGWPDNNVRPPHDPGVRPPRPGPGGPPGGPPMSSRPANLGEGRQWDSHGGRGQGGPQGRPGDRGPGGGPQAHPGGRGPGGPQGPQGDRGSHGGDRGNHGGDRGNHGGGGGGDRGGGGGGGGGPGGQGGQGGPGGRS